MAANLTKLRERLLETGAKLHDVVRGAPGSEKAARYYGKRFQKPITEEERKRIREGAKPKKVEKPKKKYTKQQEGYFKRMEEAGGI